MKREILIRTAPVRAFVTAAVAAGLLLGGCATTLAPRYDQAVVDGLNTTSTKLMTFFAGISPGTAKAGFAKRARTYAELIGSMDALTIQAQSRPIPKNRITEKVDAYLRKRGIQALSGEDAPSATAMAAISRTLAKMRDTDKKQGLTAIEVLAFKGQVVTYLDQAITYENFLRR